MKQTTKIIKINLDPKNTDGNRNCGASGTLKFHFHEELYLSRGYSVRFDSRPVTGKC